MEYKDKEKVKAARKAKRDRILFNTCLIVAGVSGTTVIACLLIAEKTGALKKTSDNQTSTIENEVDNSTDMYSHITGETKALAKRIAEQDLGITIPDHPGMFVAPEQGILSNDYYDEVCREAWKEYEQYIRNYYSIQENNKSRKLR